MVLDVPVATHGGVGDGCTGGDGVSGGDGVGGGDSVGGGNGIWWW